MAVTEQDLVTRWIELNPRRSGRVHARLIGYGVSVWALVGHWKGVGGDVSEVARAYNLPREAVEAALAYYYQNQDVIDARLLLNADAFAG